MTKLSFLDLVPVTDTGTIAQSLANAADLAKHAEALGYERYWVAEHHGMAGIASAATSVVLAHIGQATSSIRIGAGGIMLPNHAPMVIAEQFGTLEALFPGRVDLGLGRAPGSDGVVARALRRNLASDERQFPQDVVELQAFLAGDERLGIRAVPGEGTRVPLWILGSSLFGAQLAAMLGLPYAFASHFAPDALDEALDIYRRQFKPSDQLAEPYAAAAFNVFAADTREKAELLASSQQQAFVALRTGNPGKMKPPLEGYKDSLPPNARAILDHVLQCSAVGTIDDVAAGLKAFRARTGVDEIIVASSMYDHTARKHSVALAMEAAKTL
ncbi:MULTISPECIES: LLM class flavin-dependent oxidoreductase [unclassified Sphingopyxis]|uniref:LLM class flavin-dependent oxidoreductase n=1 Tax=unclassified Sphingopyxis TaxID=2614943 RepID=UPI000730A296|nr:MULTISPECIES: LLM class flavin-dependent oxidoreductase [unclassified Sphingopyxis]KTE24565.1 alkane 1-monooxygenase [Sphingopyxis sp. H057]KTE49503.1 alkane 1-monooxygenase [Sphingopyxis sp. H071]KTE52248.1 alkane 1-monooxygenase [Sphingopyxis sp. H073]KTE60593.1 alkane 1-monooxygenase [Sphingopyxis sp. H107]KTE63969.1 alkane 1-monooxygenase [Sphingopyxis sp. H100]